MYDEPEGEWSTFERFVRSYGVDLLASRLKVKPSAIYHWLRRSTAPHHTNAVKIQQLAKRRHIGLSLDQIYQHFRLVSKGGNDGPETGRGKPHQSMRRRN